MTENPLPDRKRLAHGILFVDGQPTIIFDTVCTKDRRKLLANSAAQTLLCEMWTEANEWLMGRYLLMPDHIHFFAAATETSTVDYENWVKFWKSQVTRRNRRFVGAWQAGHWDTRMRSESHYEEKWEYVRWNPVRAGLVARPEEWPFQGEIHELRWR